MNEANEVLNSYKEKLNKREKCIKDYNNKVDEMKCKIENLKIYNEICDNEYIDGYCKILSKLPYYTKKEENIINNKLKEINLKEIDLRKRELLLKNKFNSLSPKERDIVIIIENEIKNNLKKKKFEAFGSEQLTIIYQEIINEGNPNININFDITKLNRKQQQS